MRWLGHVAGVGERRVVYIISVENRKGRDCFVDLGVDWRAVLKWILKVLIGRTWTR
jgi:hypothetical protein